MVREEFTFLEITRRNVRLRGSGQKNRSLRVKEKKTELEFSSIYLLSLGDDPFLVVFRTLREAILTFLHNDTVLHSKAYDR